MKIQEKKGFTLVEVMTVVAILLILAAFAVPEARKAKPNLQLRSLAHDVLATMQRARSLAVQKNTSVGVDFDGTGYKLTEVGGSNNPVVNVKYLDYGETRFVASGNCGEASANWNGDAIESTTTVTFDSRGTAQAGSSGSGTIYLDNGLDGEQIEQNLHCYAITVQNTGSVKLRKYNSKNEGYEKKNWPTE